MTTDCLFLINPFGGGVGQHTEHCARVQEHNMGEIRVNGHAEFHAAFGVTKDRPRGFACMNLCANCANKAEKQAATVVTKGAIIQ